MILLFNQVPPPGSLEPPVKEIFITVKAERRRANKTEPTAGQTINRDKIKEKSGGDGGINSLIKSDAGVASDSAGQQHVRGEHADISYIVDGVPLPDTLSGRQGSIVVPSTIETLELLTGGYAPEFGGQTAAILNITTLATPKKGEVDYSFEGGSFDTTNSNLTAIGPIGKQLSYVFDFGANRTRNAVEPQQPDVQTAHNAGSSLSYFTKLRYTPSKRDVVALTVSSNPDTLQISNRTGLPLSFASAGQGYGFQGLRNADGSRPDATDANSASLGASNALLPSQQDAGQDITQRETSEFATLSWKRQLSKSDAGILSATFLHSGQDLHNNSPLADQLNLPADSSIEYNPTAIRNVHHVQFAGSLASKRGRHSLKAGFVVDDQEGNESYQIISASQLALDTLADVAPSLVPAGSILTDSTGNPVVDVNGKNVYQANSNVSPILNVRRAGFYRAAYLQDTWQISKRLIANFGIRADWYKQTQNLGQDSISLKTLSPRLNFSYALDKASALRWSYNRLFNTPPLAQGAVIGQAIQPEILDQYDLSFERQMAKGQNFKLAYYVKQIKDQTDTGLFIPGSQIGLYSSVSLSRGAVHGIEASYEIAPPKGIGFDATLNYSYSIASPNGQDNTGADVPKFNDHDQRNTVSLGMGYTWKSGYSISTLISHGSGLASSIVSPSLHRTPRTQIDVRVTTGQRWFRGKGGLTFAVENLLDDRSVINFQSAFSGTRFVKARRLLLSVSGSF